tara:strand:+ start:1007 stop:1264 length:258 start_codon:yes stop_codon:yes gene_type:complete
MNKNTLLTLAGAVALFFVYKNYKKKNKPCSCSKKTESTDTDEVSSDDECIEAVEMIINERLKNIRMTKEAVEKMRQQELDKCRNS